MKSIIYILLIFLVVILSGCNQKNEQVKLSDAADQILGMEDYVPVGSFTEAFNETVVYEVLEISWNDNSGVAKVKVTTPDLGQVISDSIEAVIEECETKDYNTLLEKVKEKIQSVLGSEDYPIVESTVEMEAEKNDDDYTLISNEGFEKIISGNLEEIFIQVLMEGLANEKAK